MEISKELLSRVLPFKNLEGRTWQYNLTDNNINITYNINKYFEGNTYQINIYELAFKIEDWIESKDINVIRIKENKLYEFYINAYIDEETNELFFENSITSENKINGIIAVGEFVLKEINEKQLQH